MGKTKFTKKEMQQLCHAVANNMTQFTVDFPAMAGVIVALVEAGKDPTRPPTGFKVPEGVSGKRKAKEQPVLLSYEGENIIVRQVPFGRLHYAINRIFGARKEGVFQNAPGKEWDGDQVYRTCRDKKVGGYVLPIDKKDEILALFAEQGITVKSA